MVSGEFASSRVMNFVLGTLGSREKTNEVPKLKQHVSPAATFPIKIRKGKLFFVRGSVNGIASTIPPRRKSLGRRLGPLSIGNFAGSELIDISMTSAVSPDNRTPFALIFLSFSASRPQSLKRIMACIGWQSLISLNPAVFCAAVAGLLAVHSNAVTKILAVFFIFFLFM